MSYRGTNTFAELTATGTTAAYTLPGDASAHKVRVYLPDGANDGTGTLKMQMSIDSTNWVDVPSASWTSGDNYLAEFTVYGRYIRFDLAGATSPSNMIVTVDVVGVFPSFRKNWTGLTANSTSEEFIMPYNCTGGLLHVTGTFDSAAVKVQQKVGSSWFDVTSTAVSSAGGDTFDQIGKGTIFRLNIASIVTAADLDIAVLAA